MTPETGTRTARPLEWVVDPGRPRHDGFLRLIDQTELPTKLRHHECRSAEAVWEAIKSLRVRGAPAIGIAAALGVVIGLQSVRGQGPEAVRTRLREVCDYLGSSRPTAVNLFWALNRMGRCAADLAADVPWAELSDRLLEEALRIEAEDAAMCRAIGEAGARLVRDGDGIMTHCNAGSLATAAYGTALAVCYRAAELGTRFRVFANETRPLLQGARLTAWELRHNGIDVTLLCDNMAGQVMREGRVQLVVVGADRIAANGDTANKIGTYSVAVLAAAHHIPFYVAAPSTTFDLSLDTGDAIPIEQRDPREITHGFGRQTAPDGVDVYNPAFDVTPARLIRGLITEKGLIEPVTPGEIRRVLGPPSCQPAVPAL